ncbi:MAG: cyclase family protein, partial [Cellvibrionaceae bacterium]|nr:cyclase family protein [Cellvibrionaceae bacterium]
MSAQSLMQLAGALSTGTVKVVDLTQVLNPETPVIQLPEPFAQSPAFSSELISQFDDDGPAWYWNKFSCGEHCGTHFDAPGHWISGQDYSDGTTDTLDVNQLVGPACVLDFSRESADNNDFVLEPEHIKAWEAEHGEIEAGAWVLMRTDWHKRSGADFLNIDEEGPHSPGPSPAAMQFLIEERNIQGWGVETVGTDAGAAGGFEPPFPAHFMMHGANKFGLASLANLDQLPAKGAIIIAPPLK